MNKCIERTLVALILAGLILAQGLYLPVINYFPVYLIMLIILGVYEILNWLIKSGGVISTRVAYGIPSLMILILLDILFSYMINGIFDFQSLGLVVFSMALCLASYNSIEKSDDIRFYIYIYIGLVLVSSIVEIGQFLGVSFCNTLWFFLHVGDKLASANAGERYLGLASDALQFAYQSSSTFALVTFIKFKKHNIVKKIVCFSILIPAIITNNTRSALLAMVIIVAIWMFGAESKGYVKLLSLFILLVLGYFLRSSSKILNMFQTSRFYEMSSDASSASRIPMILTAFNHALHNPLGLGIYVVSPDLIVGANSDTFSYVARNTAHNIFGNCVAAFGFIGLFLLILLYKRIISSYFKNVRYYFENNIYHALVVSIIVLAFNALFHNAYILNGDLLSMFLIGIYISSEKILAQENSNEERLS